MKWIKIDQKTGEIAKRGCNSFMPHDYISGDYRIINNSFSIRRLCWVLTRNGEVVGKFDTLKEAKSKAESI